MKSKDAEGERANVDQGLCKLGQESSTAAKLPYLYMSMYIPFRMQDTEIMYT